MKNSVKKLPFVHIGMILVLIAGAWFRFVGVDWDEAYHLHPDERFLTLVETAIRPVGSLADYFDTDASTLNPHNILDANGNQTFPFFVYGNFPIVLVRYMAELLNQRGYSEVYLVGRYLSGLFDLGTILLTFFIAKRISKSDPVALLSALLYACAPLAIQISHYFIVDNFTTFFAMFAFYFAVDVSQQEISSRAKNKQKSLWKVLLSNWLGIGAYIGFAVALGLAAASKINAVVIAALLPIAVIFSDFGNLRKLSTEKKLVILRNLFLAGLLSLITFRIFQPYAFKGPGFINISLNPKWLNNLRELSSLSSGLSNYPPSLQWTRRSIGFPIKNMILWGMGIIFGGLSILGMIYLIRKVLHGKWKMFGLLVVWNVAYLTWQVLRWNPTMRYFLLVYPTMAVSAGIFFVDFLWRKAQTKRKTVTHMLRAGLMILLIIVMLTAGAFVRIYKERMTRVAASEWIYKNVEGAINLEFTGKDGNYLQPIPYPLQYNLEAGGTLTIEFALPMMVDAQQIVFDHIAYVDGENQNQTLKLALYKEETYQLLDEINLVGDFRQSDDFRGNQWVADLNREMTLSPGESYILTISSSESAGVFSFSGSVQIGTEIENIPVRKNIFEFSRALTSNQTYAYTFSPFEDGLLNGVSIFRLRSGLSDYYAGTVQISILDKETSRLITSGVSETIPQQPQDYRGAQINVVFDEAVSLDSFKQYEVRIENLNQDGVELFLTGSKTAKETDWDDALPLLMHHMNPYDQYSGVYQSDLNFQMYWEDNADKQSRFVSILDEADYIFFTSSRQWGSLTQALEKYPLSNYFYKELIGCDRSNIQKCYQTAKEDTYTGRMGFDLLKIFQSEPEILDLEINTQSAEEAFTVYDHPKVFIFRKAESFDYAFLVDSILSVDTAKALDQSPREIEKRPGLLELPEERQIAQKNAATWSDLFDFQSLINQNQFVTIVVWYLSISFIGWLNYPLLRYVFKGLADNGWSLLRLTALILLAFINWLLGSAGITVTRKTLVISLLSLILLNGYIFFNNIQAIRAELRDKKQRIFTSEWVSLVLFLLFLLIRLGNPDLWHPYKGGEKPMDFSYFNAVIKSVLFPPYDPWYARGYINYYYWGFLLAAIPTKLTAIIPSIAYNLILPTFFSFTGMGALSIALSLLPHKKDTSFGKHGRYSRKELHIGLFSVCCVLIFGNLGTVRMFFQGIQELGQTVSPVMDSGLITAITQFFKGLGAFIDGAKLSYYPGDWYWIPSRAIPGEPITEFPFFTFLYGDPHAHLFALPITLLSLNWAMGFVKNRLMYHRKWLMFLSMAVGALIVGALRPVNTWDYPIYLAISTIAVVYALVRYGSFKSHILPNTSKQTKQWLFSLFYALLFAGISYILFYPFSKWYGQGYTALALWEGDKTPVPSYFTHWGLFLFLQFSWLGVEVIDWLRNTPLSRVETLYKNRTAILIAALALIGGWVWLLTRGIITSIVIVPALIVILMLILRKDNDDGKRFILLFAGTGLALTLIVETVALSGDIGRMNTVFKFYLQAWTLLALSSAWSFANLISRKSRWEWSAGKSAWRTILILLLISVSMYPLLAGWDKITDRMSAMTPRTLDGMEFMQHSVYTENEIVMDLGPDYELIRWMQDNIQATPTIIEANVPEYRWGNRVTIYTGLQGVIGWNWHQRQQRAINPHEWVYERVEDVTEFYSTTDWARVASIIDKYDIDYVVLGQLERAVYPAEGIAKFSSAPDDFFEIIYASDDTLLLEVTR